MCYFSRDRESLVTLISKLNDGDTKFSSDSAVNEDSNSLSDKPSIDTGQIENDKKDLEESSNTTIENDVKQSTQSDANEDSQSTEVARPVLRIKKLCDLMENDTKRQKLDDIAENENSDKVLRVHLTNIQTTVDVEEISEPVIRIEGEGTGEENQSTNCNGKWEECPLVGEEIEEEMFYVYGEGSGRDCLTGNEEKSPASSSSDKNGVETREACITTTSTSCETMDNKDVPANKLDTNSNKKTDNSLDNSSQHSEESENADRVQNENVPEPPKSPLPKKSMFFFGSPLKNTSFSSSAKVEFGTISPKINDAKIENNNDAETTVLETNRDTEQKNQDDKGQVSSEINEENTNIRENASEELKQLLVTENNISEELKKNEEISNETKEEDKGESISRSVNEDIGGCDTVNKENSKLEENIIKDAVLDDKAANESTQENKIEKEIIKDSKIALTDSCTPNEDKISSKVPNNLDSELNIPDQKTTKETKQTQLENGDGTKSEDTPENSTVSDAVKKAEVEEVICIKEVAYKCGKEETVPNLSNEKKTEIIEATIDTNDKDVPVNDKCVTSKSVEPVTIETTSENKEKLLEAKDDVKQKQIISNATPSVSRESVGKTAKSVVATKTATTIKDDQLHKSLRYFRTRRTANVPAANVVRPFLKNAEANIKKTSITANCKYCF